MTNEQLIDLFIEYLKTPIEIMKASKFLWKYYCDIEITEDHRSELYDLELKTNERLTPKIERKFRLMLQDIPDEKIEKFLMENV
jgi:polyphosphate kinase